MSKNRTVAAFDLVNYPLLGAIAILALVPFLAVLSGSVTPEKELVTEGVRLIPRAVSLDAFRMLLSQGATVIRAYQVTLFVAVVGTLLSMTLTTTLAYTLSVRALRYRNKLAFLVYFTMLFNGGMIPWYILIARTLHLKNTIWALILPMAINPFFVFLTRNYFAGIPDSLRESAQIDGASELVTWWRIYIPVSTPVLATVGLFYCLAFWNDFYHALFFIDEARLVPLQFHLYRIMSNVSFLQATSGELGAGMADKVILPARGIRFATTVVTIGPVILAYPFVQKYFVKGIMIGAIKG